MSASTKDWFQVHKEGLAAILERRGKEFALLELVSNALDTDATEVCVKVIPQPDLPLAFVSVIDDDPDGFKDLSHAFTLFAPSEKKSALAKRGRFNLGEKLVLAICKDAMITSTKGRVRFDESGRRNYPSQCRAFGSEFAGTMRMTRAEMERSIEALKSILVPGRVSLTINDELVESRPPITALEAFLATEIADADGNLKRSRAKTIVEIYRPRDGETAMLYELGIPVVETGDLFHVNVQQKIPLNMDRDNVPPAFLRELRAHVLNATHHLVEEKDATSSWVRDASASPLASNEAVRDVIERRFGEKRVAYDPSDPEANKLAVTKGYAVVHGGALSAAEWENVRRAGAILPAGQVTPSPKPFSKDGPAAEFVPREEWTAGMEAVVQYAKQLAWKLLGHGVTVHMLRSFNAAAAYGRESQQLSFNLQALGKQFFAHGASPEVDALLLHEFAHDFCSDHLDHEFAEAGFKLGAKLKRLALDDREFFHEFEIAC